VEILSAFRDILGEGNVLTDVATLSEAQTTTFTTKQNIIAIIKPANCKEIQQCVKIANLYKIPIYPISCGKNWGLGSRVPVEDNSIILDLSRLNQIIEYNEKLAYITVEPGVTFRQVYNFLREQKSKLFVSVIGGSPEASLIGNTLERGDGTGPYGDRLDNVCGLEIILPTGECIHTGFGRFANAKATNVSRWGVGPYFDGIFTQSNLGIVTKMTMWLMPIPEYFQTFTCVLEDSNHLPEFLDTIQALVLRGVIKNNSCYLWNSYKGLARKGRYPWKMMGGKTPLLLKELQYSEPWFACGALYSASEEQGIAEKNLIKQALEGKAEVIHFTEGNSQTFTEELFLGVPTEANVKSTYWRKRNNATSSLNPDKDNCGVIWLCPVFPFDGNQIFKAMEMIDHTIKSYQFEPNIGFSCTSGRSIHTFVAIMFDRNVPGEDKRGMECHNKLLDLLEKDGYIPYRLGIQSMNSLQPPIDDYMKLVSTIKQGLDPNNIISPGRYDFRKYWSTKN
jgi:4-cresol dehydrogenase (hydroxylating) flavoprotein subunit